MIPNPMVECGFISFLGFDAGRRRWCSLSLQRESLSEFEFETLDFLCKVLAPGD